MSEKLDLRVQKTYDALTSALQELLQEKTLEEISVKELCAKARVRTATFYTHFNDKYDFFFFMLKKLRESFASAVEDGPIEAPTMDYYTALLRSGMNYLEAHPKMANSIRSSDTLVGMIRLMQDDTTGSLEKHLCHDFHVCGSLQHPEVLLQFLLGGMNQVSEWWFTHQKEFSKESVLSDMNTLLESFSLPKDP